MRAYAQLRESIRAALEERAPPPLPSEIELQALWYAGAFGRDFIDTEGRSVRVVQFGEWNRSSGPDFLHACVEVDDHRRAGAIELDPTAADWEAHGHGTDPNFDEVILHITFDSPRPPAFTRTSQHRAVPRVTILPDQLDEALQRPAVEMAIARPGRCQHPLAEMPETAVASLLREAAEFRAQRKSTRFLRTADVHGRDVALFQSTAETLGYRGNALAMRLLAQRLPLSALRDSPELVPPLLFGAAGFLSPELHEKAPADTRERLREMWDRWWKLRSRWESSRPLPWKLSGQRPANHPHRRLAALATLVQDWARYRRRALARPFSPNSLRTFLQSLDDAFWSHRHTLASARSKRPVALIGSSRISELLVNHLAPLALHEDPSFNWEAYLKLPAGTRNEKVRRAAIRLFGTEENAAPWLKKAAHHQALLQIYHDFCLQDFSDCQSCPFPEQLAQWH